MAYKSRGIFKPGNGVCEHCGQWFAPRVTSSGATCWWQRFCCGRCQSVYNSNKQNRKKRISNAYRARPEKEFSISPKFAKQIVSSFLVTGCGPAMQALPNNKRRAFVEFYISKGGCRGCGAYAARMAGYGTSTTAQNVLANLAWQILQYPETTAAIKERKEQGPPFDGKRWLIPDLIPHAWKCVTIVERFNVTR